MTLCECLFVLYNWPNVNCEERSFENGEEVFVENSFLVTRWFENDEEVFKYVVWNDKSVFAWRKKLCACPTLYVSAPDSGVIDLPIFQLLLLDGCLFNRHNILTCDFKVKQIHRMPMMNIDLRMLWEHTKINGVRTRSRSMVTYITLFIIKQCGW